MWTFISNALEGLILSLPAITLTIGVVATQGIAMLMGSILDWVISPGFVSYSYTKPCSPPQNIVGDCNPIVGVGLQITQGLVNLILVVVLVYVAISIALRLGAENEAKKIFVRLIIIALLVNFAPLMIGLIVDAANIIMNFFLSSIQGGTAGVLNQNTPIIETIWTQIWNSGAQLKDKIGILAIGAAAIVLNMGVAFAFLLFAGLFIVRYLAIWILVILSPIAFVLWIVPGKPRDFWKMWWDQLINWSIIGIPIAFFLYLALGSFSAISTAFQARLSGPLPPGELSLFGQLMPFAVTNAFLFLGFIVGLATSAMGASAITAFGQNVAKAAPKWAGKKGLSTAKNLPGVERARRGLERVPGINRIPGFRPGTVSKERATQASTASKRLEEIPDTPQGNEDLTRIAMQKPLTSQKQYERAAAVELLAKRKELNLTPKQAEKLLPDAQRYGANIKTIAQARPDIASYLTETDPATGKQAPMSIRGVMDKMTPGDFGKNVQKEALQNYHVAFEATLDENKFKKIAGMQVEHKQAFLNTFRNDQRFSDSYIRAQHLPTAEENRIIDILHKRTSDIANKPQWQV